MDTKLRLIHSNRLEILGQKFARNLRDTRRDPFNSLPVLVQSSGMARWISLCVARENTVSAGLDFLYPNSLVEMLLKMVLPGRQVDQGWSRQNLSVRLHRSLKELLETEKFASPLRYVDASPTSAGKQLRILQLADRLADRFDQYIHYRPEMIAAWEAGEDEPAGIDDALWQAELFRQAAAELGDHRGRLYREFCDTLRNADCSGLPDEIVVFGLSSLPPAWFALIESVALRRPVDIYLLNPCAEYWGHLVSRRQQDREEARAARQGKDPDDLLLESGLLGSLGRIGRDFLNRILDSSVADEVAVFEPVSEVSCLGRLQNLLLTLPEPGADVPEQKRPADSSIELHLCHSPMREVEVLHDRLLAIFQEHPDLDPGDILIMAPDISVYAPFIRAVFGRGTGNEKGRLPFRISDRTLPEEHPWTAAFIAVLDVLASRFPLGGMLQLLDHDLIRSRAGLTESDLDLLLRFIQDAGIRWGVDGKWKEGLGLPAEDGATWREGFRRLLLGYAMDGDGRSLVDGRLPVPGVEGDEARRLGRFIALVEKVFAHAATWETPVSAEVWRQRLQELQDEFLQDPGDEGTILFRTALDETVGALETGEEEIWHADSIRWLIQGGLRSRGFGHGFLTGAITCCTLQPMRAVPAKVLCLLGMNLGDFPRQDPPPGFDLILRRPRPGDRSLREEDRYLFLECLLSARMILHLSCVALDPRRSDNQSPPSVLVSELLDELSARGEQTARQNVHCHRLHSFDPMRFQPSAPIPGFDPWMAEAARAIVGERVMERSFQTASLPLTSPEWLEIDLERLIRFLEHPTRFFLRDRCGIRLPGIGGELDEREMFSLNPLARYQIDEILLETLLRGEDSDEVQNRLFAAGLLPGGEPGREIFRQRQQTVMDFYDALRKQHLAAVPTSTVEWEWETEGCLIRDRLPCFDDHYLRQYRVGGIREKDRIRAWVHHLAGCLGAGCQQTWLAGMQKGVLTRMEYHKPADAAAILSGLIHLYREGLQRAQAFFLDAGFVWSEKLKKGGENPLKQAETYWLEGKYIPGFPTEAAVDDPWNRIAWQGTFPREEFAVNVETVLVPMLKWETT